MASSLKLDDGIKSEGAVRFLSPEKKTIKIIRSTVFFTHMICCRNIWSKCEQGRSLSFVLSWSSINICFSLSYQS